MNKFKYISETLEQEREEVRELLKNQINVEGFPLPILKGRLNAIVAPSHSGKTIYSMGLAITLARKGHKVMFLSTEEDREAFIEKTMQINVHDEFWRNISFTYDSEFNERKLAAFLNKVSTEGFEFLIIDYLKKSMWNDYSSDHVVMEQINSTLLRTNAALTNKLGIFTFVQGNRDAFDSKKTDFDALSGNSGNVALMIDGGMPVYRSADNILFIKKDQNNRYLFVAKSRRNHALLGKFYAYDVNLSSFEIGMKLQLNSLNSLNSPNSPNSPNKPTAAKPTKPLKQTRRGDM